MIDVNLLKDLLDFMCTHFNKSKLTNKEKTDILNNFLQSEFITLEKVHKITENMKNLDLSLSSDYHASHCCVKHGCKYGDEDCTVVNGKVKQEYLCEFCKDDNNELQNSLNYLKYLSNE